MLWIRDNDEIIDLLMLEAEPLPVNILPPIAPPKLPSIDLRSHTPIRLDSSTPVPIRRPSNNTRVSIIQRSVSTHRGSKSKERFPKTGRILLESIKSVPKKLCVVVVRN